MKEKRKEKRRKKKSNATSREALSILPKPRGPRVRFFRVEAHSCPNVLCFRIL